MEQSRGQIQTQIVNELADFINKVNQYLTTNAQGQIQASDHRTVLSDLRLAADALFVTINDSKFNKISDKSDVIIEGLINKFATPSNLLAWIENPVYVTSDNLNEGTSNLYHTTERVDARINALRPEQSAITNLNLTANVTYQTAQIQQMADKIDTILTALRSHNVIA